MALSIFPSFRCYEEDGEAGRGGAEDVMSNEEREGGGGGGGRGKVN